MSSHGQIEPPATRVGRNQTHDARDHRRWPVRANSLRGSVWQPGGEFVSLATTEPRSNAGCERTDHRDRIGPTGGSLTDTSAYVRALRGNSCGGTRRTFGTNRQDTSGRSRMTRVARPPKNQKYGIGETTRPTIAVTVGPTRISTPWREALVVERTTHPLGNHLERFRHHRKSIL